MIKRLIRHELERRSGKMKYQGFFHSLHSIALKGMNIGEGGSSESSGEIHAMHFVRDKIAIGGGAVLFDVGANVGKYTAELLSVFPECSIHCFEPGHSTFETLRANIHDSRAHLNNFGLSDTESRQVLYYDKAGSGLASLYNRQLDYFGIEFKDSEEVQLSTLDAYCNSHEIQRIDFLKLDVEGNELNVLKGARRMLSENRIKAIQLEFGGANLDSRTYLRDFWNLLGKDFRMFRIVKDGLCEISGYFETLEVFSCTNYFFLLHEPPEHL